MPAIRETRIIKLMDDEGLDRMQAINVLRAQSAFHSALRRDPRAADYRFGREF